MLFSLWAIGLPLALCCVREPLLRRSHNHAHLHKRQEPAAFPPALDENESLLVNALEAIDIDSWSYYYTHGLHVAGTNESVAQWTADRWAENGFDSRLVSYSERFAITQVTIQADAL